MISKEKIEELRSNVVGRKVQLKNNMEYIPAGTIGLVSHIDDIGTTFAKWEWYENGKKHTSFLGAVYLVDEYTVCE